MGNCFQRTVNNKSMNAIPEINRENCNSCNLVPNLHVSNKLVGEDMKKNKLNIGQGDEESLYSNIDRVYHERNYLSNVNEIYEHERSKLSASTAINHKNIEQDKEHENIWNRNKSFQMLGNHNPANSFTNTLMPLSLRIMNASLNRSNVIPEEIEKTFKTSDFELVSRRNFMKNEIIYHNKGFIAQYSRKYLPRISGSRLGFSRLYLRHEDDKEWIRPDKPKLLPVKILQKEDPQNYNNKQTPIESGDSVNMNLLIKNLTEFPRDGWWRYTMFILDDLAVSYVLHSTLSGIRGMCLSLEHWTGCEIRFGMKEFLYRGKVVRQMVIDGPTRRDIIRCKSSLPKELQQVLILDHEFTNFKELFSVSDFCSPHTKITSVKQLVHQ